MLKSSYEISQNNRQLQELYIDR
eukprot:UN18037